MKNVFQLFSVLKSHHPRLFWGAILAGVAACVFAVKLIIFTVYWMEPKHRLQPLEPWMTPGYVARAYDINPKQIISFLELPAEFDRPMTLEQIAMQQGRDVGAMVSTLQDWLIKTQGASAGVPRD